MTNTMQINKLQMRQNILRVKKVKQVIYTKAEKKLDAVPREKTKQGGSGDGMNDLLTQGKGRIENTFTNNER